MAQWVIENFSGRRAHRADLGQPGSSSAIDRTRGFMRRSVRRDRSITSLAEQSANWQRELGLTITQNITDFSGTQVPQVILCEDDDMALGALDSTSHERHFGREGARIQCDHPRRWRGCAMGRWRRPSSSLRFARPGRLSSSWSQKSACMRRSGRQHHSDPDHAGQYQPG